MCRRSERGTGHIRVHDTSVVQMERRVQALTRSSRRSLVVHRDHPEATVLLRWRVQSPECGVLQQYHDAIHRHGNGGGPRHQSHSVVVERPATAVALAAGETATAISPEKMKKKGDKVRHPHHSNFLRRVWWPSALDGETTSADNVKRNSNDLSLLIMMCTYLYSLKGCIAHARWLQTT